MTIAPAHKAWQLPAVLTAIDAVCADVRAWLEQLQLTDHTFAVELLLREALTNAIRHGCAHDARLQVRCAMMIDTDTIQLVIADDGPGFDWAARLTRTPVKVQQEHGRGLAIYQLYADTVEFNARGNQLRLVRRRVKV